MQLGPGWVLIGWLSILIGISIVVGTFTSLRKPAANPVIFIALGLCTIAVGVGFLLAPIPWWFSTVDTLCFLLFVCLVVDARRNVHKNKR